MTNPIGFLRKILEVIPSGKKLEKTLTKRTEKFKDEKIDMKRRIVNELALVKLLIDIKAAIL